MSLLLKQMKFPFELNDKGNKLLFCIPMPQVDYPNFSLMNCVVNMCWLWGAGGDVFKHCFVVKLLFSVH